MFDLNSRARHVTLGALLLRCGGVADGVRALAAGSPGRLRVPAWRRAATVAHRMRHRGGARGDRMLEGLNLTERPARADHLIRDRYKLQADSHAHG